MKAEAASPSSAAGNGVNGVKDAAAWEDIKPGSELGGGGPKAERVGADAKSATALVVASSDAKTPRKSIKGAGVRRRCRLNATA